MFKGKVKKPENSAKYTIEEEIPTILVESPSTGDLEFTDEETSFLCDKDKTEIISPTDRRNSLRRNSISLPNLDELDVLKEQVELSDDEYEETSNFRTPLRNARRKSVISPKMLRPPGEDYCNDDSNSPANSITSVNSLASLLREKIQALPHQFRKKKSPDYKTRIFVGILFITIVVLIVCAYFLYQQKILQKAYFEKIKFNTIKRVMRIYNNEGVAIVHGRLGTTINYDKVHPCLPGNVRNDSSICMEWMHRARLYLNSYQLNSDVKCYNFHWISLSENVSPTDCYDLSTAHWYGGGQTAEAAYPLEKGLHKFEPFITGHVDRHEYGNILKRYFINSKGAAIIVDDKTPLYVAIRKNPTKDPSANQKEICFKAYYDHFSFVNKRAMMPELNYSICTSGNMTGLHSHLTEKNIWDGLKKEDMPVILSLLTEPVWEITSSTKNNLTEEMMSNFTDEVISMGVLKQGHVLINEFWQKEVGDFEVDTDRFPTLDKLIEVLTRRGFRVVFTIQPFISTESFNFREAVKQRLLISVQNSAKRIPAITSYKTLETAGVLDITNNRTVPWMIKKLKAVIEKYKFNAYYLDIGSAFDMPHYYECDKILINPDQYKTHFINNLQDGVNVFGVSGAIQRPKLPGFVTLPTFESSWEGLRRVIPTILTYGILGYPFIIPGAVGGDYKKLKSYKFDDSSNEHPDLELYTRWTQLSTFLPVVRYNHLPSNYDEKLMNTVKSLATFRLSKIKPILEKYAKIALNTGLPLIRPLWMLDASDPACHLVENEFSIGEDVIVAPILYPGVRQREIYLPAGVWKDGTHGNLTKGSRWIHDYRVEEHQIAFFEKLPDNTRF